jgi:hypothetical protein
LCNDNRINQGVVYFAHRTPLHSHPPPLLISILLPFPSPDPSFQVRVALGGISEWFDDYIAGEEADPGEEPELHKGMVLLLARCWEYRLKTEDVLELCQGNRRIALCTVSEVNMASY